MCRAPSSLFSAVLFVFLLTGCSHPDARPTPQDARPQGNTSYIDAEGTAHVTRVVPVPKTVSVQAQARLAQRQSDAVVPETIEERRRKTDQWQSGAGEAFRRVFPVEVQNGQMAGVPVRIIQPATLADKRHLLINIHGGGFNSDSGSLTETVPIASLAQMKVVAVLYRLAPEHPFPAAVEDVLAVYREALKTYKPQEIGIYGTSAGAVLTGEVAVRLRLSKLPLPGALGIFSGFGDFSEPGDTRAIFALGGLAGPLAPPAEAMQHEKPYVGSTPVKDPLLSPLFADLHGFPPTLFVTSTRDSLLSGTSILHRAFLRAGVDAQLVVFEALPHAFWNDVTLPEAREADQIMANFLRLHVGGGTKPGA